jgi:hypothetical protein
VRLFPRPGGGGGAAVGAAARCTRCSQVRLLVQAGVAGFPGCCRRLRCPAGQLHRAPDRLGCSPGRESCRAAQGAADQQLEAAVRKQLGGGSHGRTAGQQQVRASATPASTHLGAPQGRQAAPPPPGSPPQSPQSRAAPRPPARCCTAQEQTRRKPRWRAESWAAPRSACGGLGRRQPVCAGLGAARARAATAARGASIAAQGAATSGSGQLEGRVLEPPTARRTWRL